MKLSALFVCIAALSIGISGCSTGKPPAQGVVSVVSAEATVKAIDHKRREVTLERADGTRVQLTVGKEVRNLPQVEVGDRVTVDMLEAVTVEVLSSGEADPGAEVAAASATAEPGERPMAFT